MWKVNAGRRSALANEFLERGVVAIGWREAGDYSADRSFQQVLDRVSQAYPDLKERQKQVSAGQMWRFINEINIGDSILTYEPTARLYHIGSVTGHPIFVPDGIVALPIQRTVDWRTSVSRDELSDSARGRRGGILTVYKLATLATTELELRASGNHRALPDIIQTDEVIVDQGDPFDGLEEQAIERVKDRLLALTWDEMQEIVASLLRALGYRTNVSPAGPDRGKDIIASKDGFGFERPRIVVEVKHRKGQMGSQEIRSFLGGRHQDDRGLYVSTGGFTREAHYEAERASTVTHLMSLDELARTLVLQYDHLDQEGRRLLPLTKIYWPT